MPREINQMFRNIVIGIDGSEGGHHALALARRLAAEGADLTLSNVYGSRMMPGRPGGVAMVWESEASERLLERERELAGLPDATILRSSESSVGRGLHEIAEYVRADLLVIGATHRRRAARTFLGDDCASVLHDAPCPVAVAPLDRVPDAPITSIGMAYDGSLESSQALTVAEALAEQLGATLQVLSVVPVHVKPLWERKPEESLEAAQAETRLADAPELGGLRVKVIEGNPADQLVLWTEHLDLLVLGTRSQGVMGRLLTGSVARHLALHAACPLLIWPRSAQRTDRPAGDRQFSHVHP